MSPRARWSLLLAITFVVLGGTTAYGVVAFVNFQNRQALPPSVDTTQSTAQPDGTYVVFRNTDVGSAYGLVATVEADDPQGPRAVTDVACDRVDGSATATVCLRTLPGVVTTFEAAVYDNQWNQVESWPLPGIPSRVRFSPSGDLVASTAFVTGHAYAPGSFSTSTTITRAPDAEYGNLEEFTLLIDGTPLLASDRNLWGVTFADDEDTFYATAASGDRTWLVRGSLSARTLTAIHDTAECPSISPDGSKIAYKKVISNDGSPHWGVAVLDLATNTETLLDEDRSVDDQVEWLDDSTLLYGLPRAAGDSDVWSLAIDPGATPQLYIEHAWSPSVVHPGDGAPAGAWAK